MIKAGNREGSDIKVALDEVQIVGTIVEKVSFNEKGMVSDAPFVLKTVRNGEFVLLEE